MTPISAQIAAGIGSSDQKLPAVKESIAQKAISLRK